VETGVREEEGGKGGKQGAEKVKKNATGKTHSTRQ
jgi:hypothetical protein